MISYPPGCNKRYRRPGLISCPSPLSSLMHQTSSITICQYIFKIGRRHIIIYFDPTSNPSSSSSEIYNIKQCAVCNYFHQNESKTESLFNCVNPPSIFFIFSDKFIIFSDIIIITKLKGPPHGHTITRTHPSILDQTS